MINSFRGEHAFLSNFYTSSVYLDDEPYISVEHAYQAAKTLIYVERERIRRAPKPGDAKRLGKKVTLRSDWNEIRLSIMEDLLRQKFTLHKFLGEWLVETGDEELQEGNTWGDRYWGTVNRVGENHLGKLLMRIREELKSAT